MSPPDLTEALLIAARAWVGAYCPGHTAAAVCIKLDSGLPVQVPMFPGVAASPPARERAATPEGKLTEADRCILEAVAGMAEAPTGQEIAKASGYPYDSHLKGRLAVLRFRGLLGGRKGDAGYPLTEPGAEALAPCNDHIRT